MIDFILEMLLGPIAEGLFELCAGAIYRALPKRIRHGSSPDGFEWAVVREDAKRAQVNALRAKEVA